MDNSIIILNRDNVKDGLRSIPLEDVDFFDYRDFSAEVASRADFIIVYDREISKFRFIKNRMSGNIWDMYDLSDLGQTINNIMTWYSYDS